MEKKDYKSTLHQNVSVKNNYLLFKKKKITILIFKFYFYFRMEIQNHRVEYKAQFKFPCKMNASATSGILETCKCRISIRMEEKGGRNFRKLGFTDINLAEYAGAGPSTQRYILQPYDLSHRLDNSIGK